MQLGFDFGSLPYLGRAPGTPREPRSAETLATLLRDPDEPSPRRPHPTRGRKLPAEVYGPDEVELLLAACQDRKDTDVRNRALLALLWRSGIRISEALRLRLADIDLSAGVVRVTGKNAKTRTVVLRSLDVLDDLQDWLDRRAKWRVGDGAPLFCAQNGNALESSYLRHFLPRLASKAGIHRRVHCHAMRHSHAAELLRAGLAETFIQRQLGHASLSTTSVYLASVGSTRQELLEQIRRE